MAEMARAIMRGLIGRQRPVPLRQQMIEARLVDEMAEEMDLDSLDSNSVDSRTPPLKF